MFSLPTIVHGRLQRFNTAFEDLALRQKEWDIVCSDTRKLLRQLLASGLKQRYCDFLTPHMYVVLFRMSHLPARISTFPSSPPLPLPLPLPLTSILPFLTPLMQHIQLLLSVEFHP